MFIQKHVLMRIDYARKVCLGRFVSVLMDTKLQMASSIQIALVTNYFSNLKSIFKKIVA
jgi:hypothetical protein